MKVLRTGLLPAVLLAAFAAAGCATPQPSASAVPPSATAVPAASAASSPSPSPSGSPVAVEPKVVCQPNTTVWGKTEANGSQVPIVITLTCENAVAAAKTVVGPDPAVAYIEFTYGYVPCPPNTPCPAPPPNTGYVVFHRKGLLPDLLVGVTADETGKVTASEPTPLPSPSPTG